MPSTRKRVLYKARRQLKINAYEEILSANDSDLYLYKVEQIDEIYVGPIFTFVYRCKFKIQLIVSLTPLKHLQGLECHSKTLFRTALYKLRANLKPQLEKLKNPVYNPRSKCQKQSKEAERDREALKRMNYEDFMKYKESNRDKIKEIYSQAKQEAKSHIFQSSWREKVITECSVYTNTLTFNKSVNEESPGYEGLLSYLEGIDLMSKRIEFSPEYLNEIKIFNGILLQSYNETDLNEYESQAKIIGIEFETKELAFQHDELLMDYIIIPQQMKCPKKSLHFNGNLNLEDMNVETMPQLDTFIYWLTAWTQDGKASYLKYPEVYSFYSKKNCEAWDQDKIAFYDSIYHGYMSKRGIHLDLLPQPEVATVTSSFLDEFLTSFL